MCKCALQSGSDLSDITDSHIFFAKELYLFLSTSECGHSTSESGYSISECGYSTK